MSKAVKILLVLVVIVVLWKVLSSRQTTVEYEPTE